MVFIAVKMCKDHQDINWITQVNVSIIGVLTDSTQYKRLITNIYKKRIINFRDYKWI